jgi:hypothetical protein
MNINARYYLQGTRRQASARAGDELGTVTNNAVCRQGNNIIRRDLDGVVHVVSLFLGEKVQVPPPRPRNNVVARAFFGD